MPRIPYAQLPAAELERQRAYKRQSARKIRKRRVEVFASTEETLERAVARMPAGLPLADFLSQLVDRIAEGRLVPVPPEKR